MTALLALSLLAAPAQAKPLDLSAYKGVSVDYVMETTGTSTCKTTYRGTGANPTVDGNRITFTGTWVILEDTCGGKTVWAAGEGKTAHHTVRFDSKGKQFEEWVVHSKPGDHERFESNIKARGQYWINELEMPAGDGFHYKVTESQGMGPLTIEIRHDLEIQLLAEAPSEPAAAPAEEAPADESSATEEASEEAAD